MNRIGVLAVLAVVAVAPVPVAGQIVVRVLTLDAQTRQPVPDVQVTINGELELTTDSAGLFALELPAAQAMTLAFHFQRLGYQPRSATLDVAGDRPVDAAFTLTPAAVNLEGIEVVGAPGGWREGFERRQEAVPGHFFTREDIEATGARRVSDVIRRVPGVSIIKGDNMPSGAAGWMGRVALHFGRSSIPDAGPCEPVIFLDDVMVQTLNVDQLIRTEQVVAIEVYTSPTITPSEYDATSSGGRRCGALVIWTDRN